MKRTEVLFYKVIQSFEPRRCCSRWGLFASLMMMAVIGNAAFAATPVVLTLSSNCSCAQIQTALDSLPPNGEVLLNPGRYEITSPLKLRHNYETLRGSGPSTILHLADGAACPVVILGPVLNKIKHPLTHLCLANLLIDGNRKNQKHEYWKSAGDGSAFNNNGVQIWNVTDSSVERVVCCHCRSGGLVTAGVRRVQVNDFEAYDNQFDGLACYQTKESHFGDLRLHDNVAAGISLDLAFNHNFITVALLTGNDLGVFMRNSRNNFFRGLTISKSRHDGVFMAQAATRTARRWQFHPGTECTGNNFENLMVSDCGRWAFRVNDASCVNNVISGARFLRNTQGGLSQPPSRPITLIEMAVLEP